MLRSTIAMKISGHLIEIFKIAKKMVNFLSYTFTRQNVFHHYLLNTKSQLHQNGCLNQNFQTQDFEICS